MSQTAPNETEITYAVRDSDLLRVLVGLAGRIAFPPEQLLRIVKPYTDAYNRCTGELSTAAIARAAGVDKSNLNKAILKWEEAGVIHRVGPQARPLRLYALPPEGERVRRKRSDSAQLAGTMASHETQSNG